MPQKKRKGKGIVIAIIIILAIVAGVVAYMYTRGPKTVKDYVDLGEKYLDEMEYDKAIEAYQSAIEVEPELVDSYVGLATAYKEKAEEIDDPQESLEVMIMAYDTLNDMLKDTEMEYYGYEENIDSVLELKHEVQDEFNETLAEYVIELTDEGEYGEILELTIKYEDYFLDSIEEFFGIYLGEEDEYGNIVQRDKPDDSTTEESDTEEDEEDSNEESDKISLGELFSKKDLEVFTVSGTIEEVTNEDGTRTTNSLKLDSPITLASGIEVTKLLLVGTDDVDYSEIGTAGDYITVTGEVGNVSPGDEMDGFVIRYYICVSEIN